MYNRNYIIKNSEPGEKIKLSGIYNVYKSNQVKQITTDAFIGKYHNKIIPTEAGIAVTEYLKEYFPEITKANFTALAPID